MFRSRSWFGGGLWKPKNPHSLEHLKYLYNVLSKNQVVSENNRGLLVETLRSIAEILIWGDQNDSSIMKQKCGSYVCVQLLQTLNILFENIRNETSLYYLLSNNHVNSIIVHKFDFSDEEVMAYYISFLKTLSLKLNAHTIHFFYNEHTNDFPLYTEAIQFFNHPESMVRIAVRTLTLNVYRVEDRSMLQFIRDKTAAPYFSNLVWFIGNHVLELDSCVRNDADHQSQNRLSDLVAEHLDHLHYLNDILCLDISDLNQVLTDHLLNKLLIPLYVYSLTKRRRDSQLEPHVSSVVSLFLLSQVFLIITHEPLVRVLAKIILTGNMDIFSQGTSDKTVAIATSPAASSSAPSTPSVVAVLPSEPPASRQSLVDKPFLEMVFNTLQCSENDYAALFALCLLYALGHNKETSEGNMLCHGRQSEEIFLDMFEDEYNELVKKPLNVEWLMMDHNILLPPTGTPMTGIHFNKRLACGEVERARRAIRVFFLVRELSLTLRGEEEGQLPLTNPQACVQVDNVLDLNNSDLIACTVASKEGQKIRRFLVIDVIQLILVEPDTRRLGWGVAKFVGFLQDIEVTGDKDDSRCLHITIHRPLSSSAANRVPLLSAKFIFDDHIRCMAANQRVHQSLLQQKRVKHRLDHASKCAILLAMFYLLQPYGKTRIKEQTQNGFYNGKEEHKSLSTLLPLDKEVMATSLSKGRIKARQKKMHMIARLLDLPSNALPCPSPPVYNLLAHRHIDGATRRLSRDGVHHRPLFTVNKVPGFAAAMRRESLTPGKPRGDSQERLGRASVSGPPGPHHAGAVKSRDGSPRSPKLPRPRSEEIPLEDMGSKVKIIEQSENSLHKCLFVRRYMERWIETYKRGQTQNGGYNEKKNTLKSRDSSPLAAPPAPSPPVLSPDRVLPTRRLLLLSSSPVPPAPLLQPPSLSITESPLESDPQLEIPGPAPPLVSEETSFTEDSGEDRRARRKGMVETV
uniref:Protein CLEC16A n=1 Tax=Timema bartmani TaxID=61472 RepID=A0A7R9HZM9_9NEOP|nr:unnamed protein product [Timema bartmani]